ncbi:MAG TPA: GNAT family N-acetyltransferase [Polyangiaceae bacterium]|jgi:predicted N-acyltransferase|nr:GNAT family N-acetyltransferase [Polyangiaceae bacterium]
MIELRIHERIRDIPRAEWDRLVGKSAPPFLSFVFLDALERAGCVSADRGWLPFHMTLWENERLVGAAPAYLKGNSEGEFVFDWGWADFAQKLRVRYYPKLVVAVPFTPATGPRVLVAEEAQRERIVFAMAEGMRRVLDAEALSSAHVLFLPDEEAAAFSRAGYALRLGVQYQWHNPGYGSFEDFLTTFPSKKRTQIRRERKEMDHRGIRIATLRGGEITAEAIDAMYEFYELTVDKFRWGRRYLNRKFFAEICEHMKENVEIVLARGPSGRPIAGALNLVGGGVLYGRYWGAIEEHPFLHFNVCYYHSIEQCIERRLVRFEPGAGGEHKRARGFTPTLTRSVHHLVDPRLNGAIREYLARERDHIERVVGGEEVEKE